MKKHNKKKGRIYTSSVEFMKTFFPKSYQEKLEQNQSKERGSFGTSLAIELMNSVRQELRK